MHLIDSIVTYAYETNKDLEYIKTRNQMWRHNKTIQKLLT